MYSDTAGQGRSPGWRLQSPGPIQASWQDVWLAVTPIWCVLALSRIMFYVVERLRFPGEVPPVIADTVQSIVLWPLVIVGCYLTIRAWRHNGFGWAVVTLILTTAFFGALARPAYAIGSLYNFHNAEARAWLQAFFNASASSPTVWYSWLSNAVEYGALYVSCTAATIGFFSFRGLTHERRLRASVEVAVTQERLRTLRAQLNPHFLFNSLNSIISLSDEQPAAQVLVTQLSNLLRRTLQASESEEHALSEELAYAEEYLEIEQTRQPSRVDWRIRVDPNCSRAVVPSLVLLPLVENAVTHGLRGGVNGVVIEITARRIRNRLLVYVGNTCSDRVKSRDRVRPALGLRNTRARLEVLFGRNATLLAHRPNSGRFEVQISLPLRESQAAATFLEGPPCAS